MSYRPVVRACAAAALTLLMGAAAAVPAAAAESPAASPEVLAAVQRDLGLTAAGAEQRLLAEAAAAAQEQALTAELGDRITGSWLDGSGRLVVRTADAAAAERVTAAGAVAAVQGRDPDEAMNRLNGAANARGRSAQPAVPASVGAWYVDEASGQVVVEATNAADGERFRQSAGDQADAVRVRRVAENPRPYFTLRGGDAIYAANGGRCSVGFSARSGSTTYVVTAGHCTEIGGTWSGYNRVAIGPVAGTSFPGDDYGVIRVTNTSSWTASSQVAGTSSVLGSTVAAIGASTCRSGSTTGYRCGTVQSRNATVNYGGGDIVYGLTRTSACAEPGDSGGSFVAGRQAQGMTSGGSGNCSVGGTTYFQPLNEVLSAYGLTLVTG
ncbi:MAG: S1 family peptidase [Pseudonocardiales bacterium]|jgi:streptogrisin C|nr:S1 family peptidase [Pseudonocardiales bacterium]